MPSPIIESGKGNVKAGVPL